jgi:hypothetical protein
MLQVLVKSRSHKKEEVLLVRETNVHHRERVVVLLMVLYLVAWVFH